MTVRSHRPGSAPSTTGRARAQSLRKIGQFQGGFFGGIEAEDGFGEALAALGDVDGDGVMDLAAGTPNDSDDSLAHGAVYVLFMAPDGTVQRTRKINHLTGGLVGPLDSVDVFGTAVAGVGDVNADGVPDLAVGAPFDDDQSPDTVQAGSSRGAVYLLFLDREGGVTGQHKISDAATQFEGQLVGSVGFGVGLGALGDADGDGTPDLMVGLDSEPGFGGQPKPAAWRVTLHGAVWTDLGGGFGSPAPKLTGLGSLVPGEPVLLDLDARAPRAPVVFVLGAAFLGAPLAGGVLGPAPQKLLVATTDPTGHLVLDDRWPIAAPPGTQLHVQAWRLLDGAPVAASGTLRATAP